MNPRPPGYEPDELPGCSTPRYFSFLTRFYARRAGLSKAIPTIPAFLFTGSAGPGPVQSPTPAVGLRGCGGNIDILLATADTP